MTQTKTAAGLRGATQACLQNVNAYIQTTAEQRERAIDNASDAIAYLHDPEIFLTEVLDQAAHKITGDEDDAKKNSMPYDSPYQEVVFASFVFTSPLASLPQAGS